MRAGKRGKTRAVSLPAEAATALYRYRQNHRPPSEYPHYFLTRTGAPMSYNSVKLVVRRARQRSGIGRLHAHLLRHSFSVAALRAGMDLMTLKETLGHSDIRTTAIYLSMSEARPRAQQRKTNPFDNVKLPKAVRKGQAPHR